MSTNIATDNKPTEPVGGLEDQIFGPDTLGDKPNEETKETPKESDADDESDEKTDDKKTDGEAPLPEGEKSPEEKKEGEEKAPEAKPEAKPATVKIGQTEYASTEDALAEATRIIGRNSQLAGELRVAKEGADAIKAELEEALKVNQQWVEWAKTQEGASPNTPKIDEDSIAAKVTAKLRQEEEFREMQKQAKQEYETIQQDARYPQVGEKFAEIVEKNISDPLTGKPFSSPKRLFDYLCKEYGLVSVATPPAKKPEEKPNLKPLAARPSGVGANSGANKKTKEKTEVDEELEQAFPLYF